MQSCEEVRENFPHYPPHPTHTPGKRFCEYAGVPGKGEVDKDTAFPGWGGASETLRREGWCSTAVDKDGRREGPENPEPERGYLKLQAP